MQIAISISKFYRHCKLHTKFAFVKFAAQIPNKSGFPDGNSVGMYQAKKELEGASVCERAVRHEGKPGCGTA
jgi:hypothetical protein